VVQPATARSSFRELLRSGLAKSKAPDSPAPARTRTSDASIKDRSAKDDAFKDDASKPDLANRDLTADAAAAAVAPQREQDRSTPVTGGESDAGATSSDAVASDTDSNASTAIDDARAVDRAAPQDNASTDAAATSAAAAQNEQAAGAVAAQLGAAAAGNTAISQGNDARTETTDATTSAAAPTVSAQANAVSDAAAADASNAATQRSNVSAPQASDANTAQAAAATATDESRANRSDRNRPASAAATNATNANATNANATSKNDPLARLLENAQVAMQDAMQSQRGNSANPVAARLAQVEGTIARDRVSKAVTDGGASIETTIRAQPDADAPVVAAAATDAQNALASGMFAPIAGTNDANAAASSGIGALDAGSASAGLASDLIAATREELPPAAQLAAKGAGILASQRGGSITMRLEPPALGQLRIELQINQGAVVADFTAATPEARVLLEANLGMLRERLESQGLSVERITVHGGRGTEAAATLTAPADSQPRQDGADARNDRGHQGDRSSSRQDAAGGESRGRRDGDLRGNRERTDAQRQGTARGFAGVLHGETARRTEPMRRAV